MVEKGEVEEMGIEGFAKESKEKEDKKKFESTKKTFFDIEDKEGFSKTDLNAREIKPLIKLYQHSKNLMPTYNQYLEENNKEDKKITGKYIRGFINQYLKAKISKNREGRKEGTEILKREIAKEEQKDEKQEFKSMIENLTR